MIKSKLLFLVESFDNMSIHQKLIIITAVGFLLRLYVTIGAVTIATDAITHLRLVSEFTSGNLYGIFDMDRPPLYALCVSLVSLITDSPVTAGRIVSLVFGTLTIPLCFYIGRFIYGTRAGILTAFFVAIHPYLVRYSGEVLTEGLYYFITSLVLLIGLKVIKDKSYLLAIVLGVVGSLAYLTKPGAMGYMIIFSAIIFFAYLRRLRSEFTRRILIIVLAWVAFLVVAAPYLYFLSQASGEVMMTGRGGASDVMITAGRIVTTGLYFMDFGKAYPEAYTYPFFLLFLIFLWKLPSRIISRDITERELWVFAIQIFYFGIYMIAGARRRYLVQIMPLGMAFSAIGFIYLADKIKVRKKQAAVLTIAFLLLFFTAVQLPKAMVKLKAHHLPEKQAGLWLAEHGGKGSTILTRTPIMVYYAGGTYLGLPPGQVSLKQLLDYAESGGAEFIAGYSRLLKRYVSDFEDERARKLKVIKAFGPVYTGSRDDGDVFVIYRPID